MKLDTAGPTNVPCPLCGAEAGAWCKRNGKPLHPVHRARLKAYNKAWNARVDKERNS